MANMSYCMFENTEADMRQIVEEFDPANVGELNHHELRAFRRMLYTIQDLQVLLEDADEYYSEG